MSVIDERREHIMRNNNTAQDTLAFLLEKMDPNTKELVVGISLHGDVDFAILREKGFQFVSAIRFTKPGEITTLSNLPNTLRILDCPKQLLVEFSGILPDLEELLLEGNYLRKIEFRLPKLKKLDINDNRISELKDLPASLEELYINRNETRILNLKYVSKLRVLHAIGNDLIRIQELPATMVDLQIEENPMVDIEYTANPKNANSNTDPDISAQNELNYIESLNAYFRLKQKYDVERKALLLKAFQKGKTKKQGQKLAKEVRPKCIRCRRPFGTIFENRDGRYIAVCGNKNAPCELNIQLYRGNHELLDYVLFSVFHPQMEDSKDSIIRQKLDTLFQYISEEKSVEKFKRQLKDYSTDNNIYKELLNEYTELHHSPHKRELIRSKIRQIYELKNAMKQLLTQYETDTNAETMNVLTHIYVKEYLPEIHNLRMLSYEVMEMQETGDTDADKEARLFQKDVRLAKLESNTGEPPRVISYKV
jgi:Leucine-rich repeat (LRR) protein